MRLYLSSYRLGDHPEYLAALVGESGRRAVVIANALDDAPADLRRDGVESELSDLAKLGFHAAELDLRDYFGHERRLRRDLTGAGLAWLRGGNVFTLRYALFRSGGDCGTARSWSSTDPRPQSCDNSDHTVRSASVGERRAARIDGYRPAMAPMTRAAPIPP